MLEHLRSRTRYVCIYMHKRHVFHVIEAVISTMDSRQIVAVFLGSALCVMQYQERNIVNFAGV